MNIHEHLVQTRNGLMEIESMTGRIDANSSIEDIVDIVNKRDTVVTKMKIGSQQLATEDPQWVVKVEHDAANKKLLEESRALLQKVADIDATLAKLIESKMVNVKKQLTFIYKASRATCSYAVHSNMKAAAVG